MYYTNCAEMRRQSNPNCLSWGHSLRMLTILIIVCIISVAVITCLSVVMHAKNNKIAEMQKEIIQRDEKIESVHSELLQLKQDMEASNEASNVHSDLVNNAANEYINKIEIVANDPGAVDWLDQPLPDAVLYNLSKRTCQNASDQTASTPD